MNDNAGALLAAACGAGRPGARRPVLPASIETSSPQFQSATEACNAPS